MKQYLLIFPFILLVSAYFLLSCKTSSPDMILLNGKIVTVDKNFSIAEAVAVHNDKIIAV